MSAMLHEMATVIADEFGAGPQVDGEDDSLFIVDSSTSQQTQRRTCRDRSAIDSLILVSGGPWLLAGPLAAARHGHPGLGEPAEDSVGGAVVQFGYLGGRTAGAVLGGDLGEEVLPGRGPQS